MIRVFYISDSKSCRSHWLEVSIIVVFTLSEGATRIASPLVLYALIDGLQNTPKGGDYSQVYITAAVLGGLSILQTFIHHILFFYSMVIPGLLLPRNRHNLTRIFTPAPRLELEIGCYLFDLQKIV